MMLIPGDLLQQMPPSLNRCDETVTVTSGIALTARLVRSPAGPGPAEGSLQSPVSRRATASTIMTAGGTTHTAGRGR